MNINEERGGRGVSTAGKRLAALYKPSDLLQVLNERISSVRWQKIQSGASTTESARGKPVSSALQFPPVSIPQAWAGV